MKTTIEISDHLLGRAKALAKQRGETLRGLTERGLTMVLEAEEERIAKAVEPVTFAGEGLSPEFEGAGWAAIRDAAYGEPESR